MHDTETAARLASVHNLKHFMTEETKNFRIPVYVDGQVTKVRVLDVHPDTSDDSVAEQLRKFGEVVAIEREIWRDHFRGFDNGVRTVRMKLTQQIPFSIIIDGEKTLVSYENPRKEETAPQQEIGNHSETNKTQQQQQKHKQHKTNVKSIHRAAAVDEANQPKALQSGEKKSTTPAGSRTHCETEKVDEANEFTTVVHRRNFFFDRPVVNKSSMQIDDNIDDGTESDLQTVSEFDGSPKKTDQNPILEKRKKFFQ